MKNIKFNIPDAIRQIEIRRQDALLKLQATDYRDTVSWAERHTQDELYIMRLEREALRWTIHECDVKISNLKAIEKQEEENNEA